MRMQRWLVLGVLACLAVPAHAQKITASIRGTVTDPTSAVIAGAKVTVKNEDTGLTRSVTTNASGNYNFAELPVGSYRVDVSFQGFKSAARTKIILNVADARQVDVKLETGEITETLSVEANAVAVKTVGAEVAGLVTGEQARELPLNGRNFMQLTLLQPGVTATESLNTRDKGLSGGSDVSVSGGSTTSNLWMVDGANNNDVGSNRTILVYPSVDSIEEFKIQRNNYGAEFGQAAGAQVNLVTKGGTNSFHGSLYYYARRDSMNSKDYFLEKSGQDKAKLKWDDYGLTIGGPIIKDKLHFFFSEEVNKDKRETVRSAFVPTAQERAGNFNGRVAGCSDPNPTDPLTGQPFPNNTIPANRINAGGSLMMQNMSLPNVTPTGGSCNNWIGAVPTPVDWRQENARVDWTITNSTRLMVRYTQDTWKADTNQWGDDPFPIVGSIWNQPGKSLVAQLNQNIGSNMVNSLTFSYSMNKIEVTRGGSNPELATQLASAIPTFYPASGKEAKGAAMPMANWGSLGPYGGGVLWNQAPWVNNQDLFVLKDDYSAVFGKHFIKAGLLYSYNKKNEEPANASQESVQVNGTAGYLGPNGYVAGKNTGNAVANWLLQGTVWNTGELKSNKAVQVRWQDYEGYLADSWKMTPKATLDIGLRVSHFTMPYMNDDVYGSFYFPSSNAAYGNSPCNGVLYVPGKNPCPALGLQGGSDGPNRSLQPVKSLLVAPRIGLAYDVFGNGKTAIRGGIGLFYSRERVSGALGMGNSPPFSGNAAVVRTLDSPTPVTGNPSVAYGAPASGWNQTAANPNNWQWNVAIEHEVVKNTVVELAYVGSKGQDLVGTYNVNEIAPANRLAYAQAENGALRPLNGTAGIGNANVGLWAHNRNSIYHALQTAVISRFGHGSQVSLAYTFSKAIADTGIDNADGGNGISVGNTYTDSTQPGLDRGRAGIDRTHVFSGSLVLALPKLEEAGGFVKNVFGDWEFTSILQASTGYPITVYVATPNGLNGNAGLAGTGYGGNQRPNVVAGQPCSVGGGSNEVQWLNPQAWTVNNYKIGTDGNSSRGKCDGPGFFQWDAALYKNINLGSRVKVQLRFEVFNVLNTTNFLGNSIANTYVPQNAVYNTGSAATATTVVSANPQGGFGQISAARDPRQMQLGLRLSF
jgi:hypothetical protein